MKQKILIVHSEKNSLDSFRQCLNKESYMIRECECIEQEIRKTLPEYNPQLIILETGIDKDCISGEDAIRLNETINLPFLFLVPRHENDLWDRLKKTLPYGLINTPFRHREFSTTVEMAFHRIAIEKRLRDEEQWLSLLVSGVGDAIITTDNTGRITFMNEEAEHISGWSFEDSIEREFTDVFHIINDKTSNHISNPLQTVFEKGIVVGLSQNEVMVDRFGTEKPVDYVIIRLVDAENNVIGVMISFGNSVKRRFHFKSFNDYEAQFRDLVENASDIIFSTDRHGRIHYINPAVTSILGYKSSDTVGSHYSVNIHPEYTDMIQDRIRESIHERKKEIYLEFPAIHSNGSSVWMSLNLRHFYNNSTWLKSQGVMRDISRLKDLISETERAKNEAEIANRSKTMFIANISHEIRTPLNAILGYTQLLEMEEAGSLNEKQVESLKVIHENSDYLLQMLNDVLDLAKVETGKIDLHKTTFHLSDVINRVKQTCQSFADEKNISLVTVFGRGMRALHADEVKVKQIIYNLISNAVKFSPPGNEVRISARAENSNAVIDVIDSGIGISENDRARIFDAFRQAGKTVGGSRAGAGLGLAITRKLVEMHGGTINVESVPGSGSTFTVIIPGLSPHEQEISGINTDEPGHKPAGSNKTAQKRILILDDERTGRRMLERLLTAGGYAVESAENGESALEILERVSCDLVLMDIQLSGMSGQMVLNAIRQSSAKEIPVIAVTAHVLEGDREKFLLQGFDSYLPKPLDLKQLLNEIERFLPYE